MNYENGKQFINTFNTNKYGPFNNFSNMTVYNNLNWFFSLTNKNNLVIYNNLGLSNFVVNKILHYSADQSNNYLLVYKKDGKYFVKSYMYQNEIKKNIFDNDIENNLMVVTMLNSYVVSHNKYNYIIKYNGIDLIKGDIIYKDETNNVIIKNNESLYLIKDGIVIKNIALKNVR